MKKTSKPFTKQEIEGIVRAARMALNPQCGPVTWNKVPFAKGFERHLKWCCRQEGVKYDYQLYLEACEVMRKL